jgi:K+ transporter
MITGAFSRDLRTQAVQMESHCRGCRSRHTSATVGRIIPLVSRRVILWLCSCGFKPSHPSRRRYGIAVTRNVFITTVMMGVPDLQGVEVE